METTLCVCLSTEVIWDFSKRIFTEYILANTQMLSYCCCCLVFIIFRDYEISKLGPLSSFLSKKWQPSP